MEVEAVAAPAASVESQNGGTDNVIIHPYLYPHALIKTPLKLQNLKKQVGKLVSSDKQKEAQELFLGPLERNRNSLGTALESLSVSDAAVSEATSAYLSMLLGLVQAGGSSTNGSAAGTASAAASLDEALEAAEGGAAPILAGPKSSMRTAIQWGWSEAALAPAPGTPQRTSGAADAVYELGSSLVGAAIRLMRAAAEASKDSASGVATPASTRSYRLLREAAGMLELAAGEVLPLLAPGLSADCDPQVVRALASVALADAQQLTVLRAIAKGNQPALIASLAVDTAELYRQAGSQLGSASAPGARSSKLSQFAQYKQAYCLAYAHIFNGISLWRADKPGEGLKSLEAAAGQLAAAKRAAGQYDAAPPASLNLHHRRVDEDVERVLQDTQRRMQRENDTVYVQRVAAEVPPLPAGKRLVSALRYALPAPAPVVKEGALERWFGAAAAATEAQSGGVATAPPRAQVMHSSGGAVAAGASAGAAGSSSAAAPGGSSGTDSADQGCSCCRWVCAMIALPVLILLWLVGAILWVLLLPLKCCCPCIGMPLQWLIDGVLYLMKLPARTLLWASGGPEDGKTDSAGSGNKK